MSFLHFSNEYHAARRDGKTYPAEPVSDLAMKRAGMTCRVSAPSEKKMRINPSASRSGTGVTASVRTKVSPPDMGNGEVGR
jgi:hypothetical protein